MPFTQTAELLPLTGRSAGTAAGASVFIRTPRQSSGNGQAANVRFIHGTRQYPASVRTSRQVPEPAQDAPRAAWCRVSISMRQPEPLFVNTLVAALVAHARGVLDAAALDAAFEGSNLPKLAPLPQQFVVLAGPVMTNFESKNNLGKPERDTRVSTAAQRHLARMVAAEGLADDWA